jgi:hypothetical protein
MTTYTWPLSSGSSGSTSAVPPVFTGVGSPRKAEEIKLLVPQWLETRFPSVPGALLQALGVEDQRVTVGDRTLFIRSTSNANGNVLYVAKIDDPSIRVQQVTSSAPSAPLTIAVSGKDVLVSLATDAGGNNTTTASQLQAAVAASPAASALVSVTTFGTTNAIVGSTGSVYVYLDPDGLEGARRGLLLLDAAGSDLAIIGRNYGIAKPVLLGLTDDSFRAYIASIAFQKKVNRAIIEGVLTVIFGPKSTAGWSVYESLRKKTITIEVGPLALPSGPVNSTFLRPLAVASPPTSTPINSTLYDTGDYLRANVTVAAEGRVQPFAGGGLSAITNNSVYAKLRGANRPAFLNVMQLIRAAGVQAEFVQQG